MAFLFVLLLIILAVLLYDFLPDFMNWVGRIKIGCWQDEALWLESVKNVNLKWLSKGAPEVPKNENQRLKLIKKLKEIKKTSPISYWQEASLLKAATKNCGNEVNESVSSLTDRYIDIFTGEWKSAPQKIDAAILAYEMMSNEYIDNKTIEPAMDCIAEMLKEKYEAFGSVPYNDSIADIRFVDTVGMICPFLIKYAKTYEKPEFITIATEQIIRYCKYGVDRKTGLPYHCYNEKDETHLGICGWGRGCGWWAVGLTDSLKELMDIEGFNKEKTLILKVLDVLLAEVGKHMGDDGSIGRMLLNESLPDSSAAAMLAYSFAFMYTLTENEAYRKNAVKILGFIRTVTRRNGVIDFSQGDTMGIGYYSSGLSVMPAAQGFTISAAELLNN